MLFKKRDNNNESKAEKLNRREFIKKTGKTVLPALAIFGLSLSGCEIFTDCGDTCSASCSNDCSETCTEDCATECTETCTDVCANDCEGYCSNTCTNDCEGY